MCPPGRHPGGCVVLGGLEKLGEAFASEGHAADVLPIIGEMRSANGLPDGAKMSEWRNRLDVLHRDLENALRQISNLLRTA